MSENIAVGYIRTTMLTRVLPIVGEDRIVRIAAHRSVTPSESHDRTPWLRHTVSTQDEWSLRWRREMGPLNVDLLWKELLAGGVSDLTITELDWIAGPYLLKMESNSTADVRALRYVSELSKTPGRPTGVLDLTDVRRALRGFPKVNEFDGTQIRAVLHTLRADEWPKEDRTVTVDGVRVVAKPAAVRHYSETPEKTLKLIGEEDA